MMNKKYQRSWLFFGVRLPLMLVLFGVVLLSGCAKDKSVLSRTAVELPPVAYDPQPPVVPATLISVPAAAPWLGDLIEVHYLQLSAITALQQIVPNGLLVFDFAPDEDLYSYNLTMTDEGVMENVPVLANKSSDINSVPVKFVNALPGVMSRKAHIDALCVSADWAWTLIDRVIVISPMATKIFDIGMLPGTVSGRVNNYQISFGEDGSNALVDQESGGNPYEELLEAVSELIGDGQANLMQTTGQIIVTAKPSVLDRVSMVIEAQTEAAGRRVALEFVLYEVDITDSINRQLDLIALRDAAISASLTATAADTSSVSGIGALSIGFNNGSVDGSSFVFRWLQDQGETQVRIRKNVVAVHNQITELSDIETVRYVEQVKIERESSGSTSNEAPSVQTGEARIGETWAVLPTIVNGVVTLRLATARGGLIGFEEFDFSNGAIAGRLPQTSVTAISTPIRLRHGETRVITDLSSSRGSNSTLSSPLLSWIPWIGDSISKSDSRLETVMTMTARIL